MQLLPLQRRPAATCMHAQQRHCQRACNPPPTCRRRPPAAPQVVKYLGLEGVCGGPTVSWWPVKEQVQVVQGISAIVARLDFAGLIQ